MSHVIPEFLYAAMYDDKRRFLMLSRDNYHAERFQQKGLRERLLCDECESQFSLWERYASNFFSGELQLSVTNENGIDWVSGIDYEKFKLFQMSILWRCGVATGEFFSQVKLGPHQERLRHMLLNRDPGNPVEYGCMMQRITLLGQNMEGIVQPTPARLLGVRVIRMTFGGYFWAQVVSSHFPKHEIVGAFLQRSGRLALTTGDMTHAPYMTELLDAVASRSQTLRR